MIKKRLLKSVLCGLVVTTLTGNIVFADSISLSSTMDSDYKRVAFSYTPPASTRQDVTLSGYQYHPESKDHTAKTVTRTKYGANTFNDSFTSMTGYVYELQYNNKRLTLKAKSDGVVQATVYPQ